MFVQTSGVCLQSSCSSGLDSQQGIKTSLSVFIVILRSLKGNLSLTADKPKATGILVVLVPATSAIPKVNNTGRLGGCKIVCISFHLFQDINQMWGCALLKTCFSSVSVTLHTFYCHGGKVEQLHPHYSVWGVQNLLFYPTFFRLKMNLESHTFLHYEDYIHAACFRNWQKQAITHLDPLLNYSSWARWSVCLDCQLQWL